MARWTMFIALSSLALGACGKADDASTAAADTGATAAAADSQLAQALGKTDDLSETAKLVNAAGLEKTFGGVGSYTIFAPTNAAIAALPEAERSALASPAGRTQLIALLSSHVSPGYISPADLDTALTRAGGSMKLASVGAAPIALRKEGDAIILGDGNSAARITGKPIAATNGMIYPIDHVLPAPIEK
ncbi:MAG: fasciclin domain-containing protein [Pseudomonadota bacterium]